MKILVLSDSHQQSLNSDFVKQYDAVFHCGDYGISRGILEQNKAYYVAGNCDVLGAKELVIRWKGRTVLLTHGQLESVKYGFDRLVYKALDYEVSVVFFGHTHRQTVFEEDGILFVNPGAYPDSYAEITDEALYLHQQGKIRKMLFKW